MTNLDLEDLNFMLRNPQSRRFLWWLISSCGIYGTSYSETHAAAAFREGERNVALKILAEIGKHYPLAYADLMREQQEAKLREMYAAAATREGATDVTV